MKKTLQWITACALLAGATGTFAQGNTPVMLQNVAQLSAQGTVEVQQDMLSISLATSRDGADAATVQTQLKQALDAALAEARKTALPGQMDVRTGNFNLNPRYGKDGKINGWQGRTELVLEGRDFTRITTTAGKIQSLTLGNVSFALSREMRAKVEAEAQTMAIERFKLKANEIAKSFGFSSYTLREVAIDSSDNGYSPRPRVMAMSAKTSMDSAPIPVEAGISTVQVNVNGSVQMK